MSGTRDGRTKLIVFFFLTALVALIAARMVIKSGGVREEIVLKEQFRYFENILSKDRVILKTKERGEVEEEILLYLGSSFHFPDGEFEYFAPFKIRAKKVKVAFIPFVFEKELYLMGIYSPLWKGGRRDTYFLDTATLLSGEKGAVSFVVFERKEKVKVSLMSTVTVEELFRVTRSYFMKF